MRAALITTWTLLSIFVTCSSAAYNARYHTPGRFEDHDDLLDDLSPRAPRSNVAHLLVDKRILNKFLVESADIIVKYSVYNIGHRSARDVHLWDASFDDADKFVVVGGLTDVVLGSIPPGSNVSHTIVVRPLKSGPFHFGAARIEYTSEDDKKAFGTSSEPGNDTILSTFAFHRQFSPHLEEWAAFAMLTLPCLLIPYLLWLNNKSKYEKIIKESGGAKKKKFYTYRDR